jgi:hypothetical protein
MGHTQVHRAHRHGVEQPPCIIIMRGSPRRAVKQQQCDEAI